MSREILQQRTTSYLVRAAARAIGDEFPGMRDLADELAARADLLDAETNDARACESIVGHRLGCSCDLLKRIGQL